MVREVKRTARENVSKADLEHTSDNQTVQQIQKILQNFISFIRYSLDQRSSIKNHHKVEEDAGQEEVDAAATQPGQLQDGGRETRDRGWEIGTGDGRQGTGDKG